MKNCAVFRNCKRWLLLALAAFPVFDVRGQGIIYVQLPPTSPASFPWDSLGTQVGPDLSIVINGQTALTFSAPVVDGQPSEVVVNLPGTSAIIGQQPYSQFPNDVWVVPLSAGTEIGSDAAGYNWLGSGGSPLLASSTASGDVNNPWITAGYFAGLESGYFGFQFQQSGQTYYGWFDFGSPVVGLNAGWAYNYAYESTPTTPIFAGEVPEPGTVTLLLIGGLFYSAWRVQFRRQVLCS